MSLPGLVGAAHGERGGAHQPRSTVERGEGAIAQGTMKGFAADIDPALDGKPSAAATKVVVGGQKIGKTSEAIRRCHPCRMYSIADPPEALDAEAVTTIYGTSSDGHAIDETMTSTSIRPETLPVSALPRMTMASVHA